MPADPPILDMPLWTLGGAWIRVRCSCGRSADLPTRILGDQHAEELVGGFLARLRCKACGGKPAQVFYADRADTFVRGGPGEGRRIWLVR